jgi:two-component sensor histidine kinase
MKNIKWVLCLIWLLPVYLSYGQKKPAVTFNSLITQLNTTGKDTSRIKALQDLGWYYLYKHGFYDRELYNRTETDALPADSKKAFEYFNKALTLSSVLKLKEWQNKTLELIAIYYFEIYQPDKGRSIFLTLINDYHKSGNLNRAAELWIALANHVGTHFPYEYFFGCYEKAYLLYKQNGNKAGEFWAYKKIAYLNLNDGKVDLAEKQLQQLLLKLKAIHYRDLFYTYDMLADANKLKGNPDKELYYQIEMVKSLDASGKRIPAEHLYHKIGVTYFDLNQYQNSLYYLEKSIEAGKAELYPNIVVINKILITQNRVDSALLYLRKSLKTQPPTNADLDYVYEAYGDIYMALKQYKTAENYYLKRFKPPFFTRNEYRSIRSYELNWSFMNYYQLLSNLYIHSGQYQKASSELQMIPVINHGKISPLILAKLHLMNFKLDSASGNYVSAIQHFQLYKSLNDSLFNVAKINQVNEIDIKYKTVQNKQSIKLLQAQERNQRVEVQKANLQRNLTIGGIFLLLITVGIGYRNYRNKQKTNEMISKRNQQLQALLTEKEWLLKEVHHRVKNNLHTVMCLLGSQAEYLESDAFDAIKDSMHRIYAMSLIHQKLYQSEDIKTIDMAIFLPEFISYLEDSFGRSKQIAFKLDLRPIKLNVSEAIPLSLIINEAVTNAIKYAFPENQKGKIEISLFQTADQITMIIADNGIGISQSILNGHIDSLGLKLIFGLGDDIHASVKLRNDQGTKISVSFKFEVDPYIHKIFAETV